MHPESFTFALSRLLYADAVARTVVLADGRLQFGHGEAQEATVDPQLFAQVLDDVVGGVGDAVGGLHVECYHGLAGAHLRFHIANLKKIRIIVQSIYDSESLQTFFI